MKIVRVCRLAVIAVLMAVLTERFQANAAPYDVRIPRMVRGRDANINDWTFIVYLNFHQPNPKWKICTGALFKKNWIITAAHCVEDIPFKPHFITVTAGIAKRSSSLNKSRTYKVAKIVAHRTYMKINSNTNNSDDFIWDYDIALVKLQQPVDFPFSDVQLPAKNFSITDLNLTNVQCKSAGWGSRTEYEREIDATNQRYKPSDDLQEINVLLVSKQVCRKVHHNEVTDLVFCGGQLLKNAMTSCIGDSGSPLVCKINNVKGHLLAGIMLGGNKLCKTGADYMMFTEVAKFRDWIDDNSRDSKSVDKPLLCN